MEEEKVMAEQIDAQGRLEAVQALIGDCETTAVEIEGQFAELDTIIGISETRTERLLTDVDNTATEIIGRSEAFTGNILARVEGVSARVAEFVTNIEGLLATTDEQSGVLFERFRDMDMAHNEIQAQIDENAQHMKEIFQAMTTQWIAVGESIASLQEERTNEIDTDVRQLAESQTEQQTGWQQETIDQGIAEQAETIVANVNQHMNEISEDFEQSFSSGVDSVLEQSREMLTQTGNSFSQMREGTLDNILGSTKDLYDAVDNVMNTMTTTVGTTSNIADTVVDAMDQTNVGLNEIIEAIENVMQLLGGLSLD